MHYSKIHDAIINRALTRKLSTPIEKHHIIPRCMGGTNDKSNIARLTPREHFIIHQLLVKIHPDNFKLVHAANMMSNFKKCKRACNSRRYNVLKELHAKQSSLMNTGVKLSKETRRKISAATKGKRLGPANGMYQKTHSEVMGPEKIKERGKKISAALCGKPKSDSHKENLSIGHKLAGNCVGPKNPHWGKGLNRNKKYKSNKSGYVGVCERRRKNGPSKWAAQINRDGVVVSLGVFGNIQDAIVARKRAESQFNS